jgi:hypothetical protein
VTFAQAGNETFRATVEPGRYLGGYIRSLRESATTGSGKLFAMEVLVFADTEAAVVDFENWGPESEAIEEVSSAKFGDSTTAVTYTFADSGITGHTLVFRAGKTVGIVSSSALENTPPLSHVESGAQSLCERLLASAGG